MSLEFKKNLKSISIDNEPTNTDIRCLIGQKTLHFVMNRCWIKKDMYMHTNKNNISYIKRSDKTGPPYITDRVKQGAWLSISRQLKLYERVKLSHELY